MISFSKGLAGFMLAVSALVLGGCATPVRPTTAASPRQDVWTGRMALQVEGNASESFSAGFELKGNARTGDLTLFTPLGSTLAVLSWAPGAATLRASGKTRQFDSVDTLAEEATGTPIPVAALFDWLSGANTQVPGWETDLSQLPQGRLRARRVSPPPQADLRVAFDH
ncbi:MAG TPA: outer membrane lipoprotein LolB [Ramlibacter sp.]|uniref:outer membrane lipoprotein LolB n=1 Tax=Ramlibacter sp. TaxID=1917967 RepID=UPI002BBC3C53|nr:outer membrane lipoprotein LolB [Ramlibacter sp.]HVZ44575.1 outer membrane lipoprotein LolB [Ramlibacter sp.]